MGNTKPIQYCKVKKVLHDLQRFLAKDGSEPGDHQGQPDKMFLL